MKLQLLIVLLMIPCVINAFDDEDSDNQGPEATDAPTPKDKEGDADKALKKALGSGAKAKPLNGGGGPITSTADLNCTFDVIQGCNWSNARKSALKWSAFDGEADAKAFRSSFDTSKAPQKPFAVAASGPTDAGDEAVMLSGLICQQKPGQLSFTHYLTDGVKLKVCRQRVDKTVLLPCQEYTGNSDGIVAIVDGMTPEMFQIAFVATNFEKGGVAILKDVSYGAVLCKPGKSGGGGGGGGTGSG